MATHAFITWDDALGRRMCPLATFGARAPLVHRARLVCVDPPRADRPALANADAVRGAIALVVRGGCSFIEKAQRIYAAGAIAMILANNTREEPFEMFTMAADETTMELPIPCVMMCLVDVRELFKQYPPTVQTGVLTLEIHEAARERELVAECDAARQLAIQQCATKDLTPSDDGGWGAALKRKTTSLIKRWEAPAESPRSSTTTASTTAAVDVSPPAFAEASPSPPPPPPKSPVFAFVQWATSASEYVLFFAPLGDFCAVASDSAYDGPRVVCDPLMAHEPTLRNATDLTGAMALVQRGACTFPAKLERIQRCGAAAAIVGNDDADDEDAAFVMTVDHVRADHVTIPAVMVSRRVFQRLVETDCPPYLRILCLSGEAAAACLARAGGTPWPIRPAMDVEAADDASLLARFHAACRAGDHGACQRILDEHCRDDHARRVLVSMADAAQRTAHHYACAADAASAGAEHVITLLKRLGAVVTARDGALNTPLHVACLGGHAAIVKRLLIETPNVATARNLGGATPMHYAALAGSTACVELLLSVNARRVEGSSSSYYFDGVDAVDADGATPLHVAAAATHVDCVLYLVAANANLRLRDRRGRTALDIACALVNTPASSLAALHIVEKLVAAGAPVMTRDDALAIDVIASKAVKRELEIAFLRREARASRSHVETLTSQLAAQAETLAALQETLSTMEARQATAARVAIARARRIGRQQQQIEQLQLQMKTLLTVLHRTHADGNAVVLADAATATSLSADDDETRAQDAALARDLGKKCCRTRQFALAQTYLERSLAVFPLPGVARLLAEVKTLRRAAETTVSTTANDQRDGARLRRAVVALDASASTKDALLREIAKLDAIDAASSDYGATVKWIEWLVALPWASDETRDLTLAAAVFGEMERMETETKRHHEHRAARVIQRTFRERFAVQLLRRAMASAAIQRVYRRYRQRREQQRLAALAVTRHRQRDAEAHEMITFANDDDDDVVEMETPEDLDRAFDVATTVDPRLRPTGPRVVVRGDLVTAPSAFVVLQLVATGGMATRRAPQAEAPSTPPFYVWKRWGASRTDARQASLCGPYDDLETAAARYERLLSACLATEPRENDSETTKQEALVDAPAPSAWTWLRASAS